MDYANTALFPALPLPQAALRALDILESAGYDAWIVGGCVRDFIMHRPCTDIDIASAALWEDAERLFLDAGYRVQRTGTKHGTITVLVDDQSFEVTTFRIDGMYKDARHPKQVKFVRTIEEDLARRDFTMNAIAYHPQRGYVDKFNGLGDIQQRVIRAVGNPNARFNEDALRILRGCRFCSQLGFTIEPLTYQDMYVNKGLMTRISPERALHELDLFILGDYVHDALLSTVDIMSALMPELVAAKGFDQKSKYHCYDVLEHTAYAMQNVPRYRLVRWAAFLHDLGKPASYFTHEDGIGHFYLHAKISAFMAEGILRRLKMSPSFMEQVCLLVRVHDDFIEPTPKSVKRMLAKLDGNTELFCALCDLKFGDAMGHAPSYRGRAKQAMELKSVMNQVLVEGEAFSLKHLAINGRDVINAGVEAGPEVGRLLKAALSEVIDEHLPNTKEALMSYVLENARPSEE